ncbi:UNVERIFIED_ORG: hypothetical protein ABIC62_005718 [Burkholderia sp. 1595]|uniref:Uncharacterized protein n=1 Tax=Paraburkholderia terricola TaxID=169427 RepID=A0ABU1LZN1_9BURK|nr:hypothetical protein [Paraburkholderia terricola]
MNREEPAVEPAPPDPSPDESRPGATRLTLSVRAATGALRIVAVWQALGAHAAQARWSRVHCHVRQDVDELTVTFGSISPAELAGIAQRLNALPWVVAASFHVADLRGAGAPDAAIAKRK